MAIDKIVSDLQKLSSMSQFSAARKTLFGRAIAKHDWGQENSGDHEKRIESLFSEDPSLKSSFGGLTPVFLKLIQYDLSGLGPASFFLETPGWLHVTTWGQSKVVIELAEGQVHEVPIGLINPHAPQLFTAIEAEIGRQFNDGFPVIDGRWGEFIVQGVLPPVSKEIWFRISRRDELLQRWLNLNV